MRALRGYFLGRLRLEYDILVVLVHRHFALLRHFLVFAHAAEALLGCVFGILWDLSVLHPGKRIIFNDTFCRTRELYVHGFGAWVDVGLLLNIH